MHHSARTHWWRRSMEPGPRPVVFVHSGRASRCFGGSLLLALSGRTSLVSSWGKSGTKDDSATCELQTADAELQRRPLRRVCGSHGAVGLSRIGVRGLCPHISRKLQSRRRRNGSADVAECIASVAMPAIAVVACSILPVLEIGRNPINALKYNGLHILPKIKCGQK